MFLELKLFLIKITEFIVISIVEWYPGFIFTHYFKYFDPDTFSYYLPKDNFSPESGGSVKSRTAMEDISKQGTIKLKK